MAFFSNVDVRAMNAFVLLTYFSAARAEATSALLPDENELFRERPGVSAKDPVLFIIISESRYSLSSGWH